MNTLMAMFAVKLFKEKPTAGWLLSKNMMILYLRNCFFWHVAQIWALDPMEGEKWTDFEKILMGFLLWAFFSYGKKLRLH